MSGRVPCPFRPGYSLAPALLAGRDDVLFEADEAIAEVALDRRATRGRLLVGVRGVGKTVLLSEIATRAGERYGFPRLRVQADSSGSLIPELEYRANALGHLIAQAPSGRLRSSEAILRAGVAGVGAEVHLTREPAPEMPDKLRLETAIDKLVEELRGRDSGLVITIDEAQLARRAELEQLGSVLQHGSEQEWPLLTVIAALPSLRDAERLGTFFERAQWFELGLLDDDAAIEGLAEPAAAAGRPFDPDAARYTAAQTGGYPYAIQLYGQQAWRAADGQPRITLAAATNGAARARVELERSLYAQRWKQAPRREQEYLLAVARAIRETGRATGAEVARRLGVQTRAVSSYRARLLERGTLVAEGDGLLFAIPGMGDYVLAHDEHGTPAGAARTPAQGPPRPPSPPGRRGPTIGR
jgi:hypothetical protein